MSHALDPRVRSFRARVADAGAAVVLLLAANALTTPHVPWFILPAIPLGVRLARDWGALHASGLGRAALFGARAMHETIAPRGARARASERGAVIGRGPHEPVASAHAATVRLAIADHGAVLEIVHTLGAADRALLPEVEPTATALLERVHALVRLLDSIERDSAPERLARVEARLRAALAEPVGAADRERRIALLEHQRRALAELGARAERARGQLARATLALETLRLDLVRLRAHGVQSLLAEVTQATQQARALSRDIAHALDAAREVREI